MSRQKKGSGKKKGGSAPTRNRQSVVRELTLADNTSVVPQDIQKKKAPYFEIDVIKKSQKGVDYFSGEMSLAQLAALTHVDNYDGDRADEGGGQRALCELRGKQFREFIVDCNNVCFAEILLNDRNGEVEFRSLKDMGITVSEHAKLGAMHGFLKIPSGVKLFVYDGQTRRFGYLSLLHFDLDMFGTEAYKDYKHLNIPFCLCQVSAREETLLFLQHNKQISVPNDHKAMVSWHANKDLSDMKHYTYSEKASSIIAGLIYIMDRDRKGPWFNRIVQPDLSKEENKRRFGTHGGFNTGLKHFIGWLNRNYWSPETTISEKSEDLADICTTYWRAMQKTCPKIWRNPENYIQLRPHGISTLSLLMHTLYIDFFDRNIDWNIGNLHTFLKKSKLITTPIKWEIGGDLHKRGGNYKALQSVEFDIYQQIKKG